MSLGKEIIYKKYVFHLMFLRAHLVLTEAKYSYLPGPVRHDLCIYLVLYSLTYVFTHPLASCSSCLLLVDSVTDLLLLAINNTLDHIYNYHKTVCSDIIFPHVSSLAYNLYLPCHHFYFHYNLNVYWNNQHYNIVRSTFP